MSPSENADFGEKVRFSVKDGYGDFADQLESEGLYGGEEEGEGYEE
jgi:hypothetical protein